MKTVDLVAKELGVYIKTLNNFQEVFGLNFQYPRYVEKPQLYYFGGYQEIKEELYLRLISIKNEIVEFEKDYYKYKTPKYISDIIGHRVEDILRILNEKRHFFIQPPMFPKPLGANTNSWNTRNYFPELGATSEIEIKHVSSYKILKILQEEDRMNRLVSLSQKF